MVRKLCVVTVTYGDRFRFVKNTIERAIKNSITKIILVANKAAPESLKSLKEVAKKEKRIELVVNRENLGSAIGYGMGIKTALSSPDCEFILLLDDDTAPKEDAISVLSENWQKLRSKYPEDNFGLVCFRPDHQIDIARGLPPDRCYLKPGAFFGFHFFNIPYRLWRFTPWGPKIPQTYPDLIEVPYAAYGGFFAHRSVYEKIGVPLTDFILYEDDLEYTLRLTRRGGKIFLCPRARIESLESSWGSLMRYPFGIFPWLDFREDFRIYYGARNVAYFEKYYYNNKILRVINRTIYLTALFSLSVLMKKKKRFKLILNAIKDGETRKLGYHKSFPLP